jgi:ABC-2 type transport system ATP-binding protein
VDAQPEEPAPASPGRTAGRSGARGGSAGRRSPTAKKPAGGTRTSSPSTPAAGKTAAGKAASRKGPSPAAGSSRSVARSSTVGRAAAASLTVEAVLVEPEPAESELAQPVVETEPEPAPTEPTPEPAPEPDRRATATLAPLGEPSADLALAIRGLTKRFGGVTAVDGIGLDVPRGCFYGFVGPNGAGKTTTLAMVTGLLRPDAGTVLIDGADVWTDPATAKSSLGVLPDRLRLFDRLTGLEFLHHAGALHGLDRATVARRAADLVQAFGLESASRRFVSDFSAGMVKKIAIAAAMIHSPRLLVLDEPFESVDPVSAQLVIDVLKKFARVGGTVLLSSHSMDLIERVCDNVAIIAEGRLLAAGPMAEVLDGATLENRFVELAGGATAVEGMEWLQSFSD